MDEEEGTSCYFFLESLFVCLLLCSRDSKKIRHVWLLQIWKTAQLQAAIQICLGSLRILGVYTILCRFEHSQSRLLCMVFNHKQWLMYGYDVHLRPMPLGYAGTIYNCNPSMLQDLGLQRTVAKEILKKLHMHAITSLHNIIKERRYFENNGRYALQARGNRIQKTGGS